MNGDETNEGDTDSPRWTDHPAVETERLRLRRVEPTDAEAIRTLAGEFDVAHMTAAIPHPYEEGMAEAWMASVVENFESRKAVVFAVALQENDELIGVIGLTFAWEHERAEIGYWFGKPFWGHGYASEAAQAVVDFGFDRFPNLQRVHAGAFAHNPASCRVLEKAGLRREGVRRRHFVRFGEPADIVDFGLLRSDRDS